MIDRKQWGRSISGLPPTGTLADDVERAIDRIKEAISSGDREAVREELAEACPLFCRHQRVMKNRFACEHRSAKSKIGYLERSLAILEVSRAAFMSLGSPKAEDRAAKVTLSMEAIAGVIAEAKIAEIQGNSP